ARQVARIIGAIAIEKDEHIETLGGAQAGAAGIAVAGALLADDSRPPGPGDVARAVVRRVVHDDDLVDRPRRHRAQDLGDGAGLILRRDDQCDAGHDGLSYVQATPGSNDITRRAAFPPYRNGSRFAS